MLRIKIVLAFMLLFFVPAAGANSIIPGTYQEGSDVTEPRPVLSKHLLIQQGGFIVLDETQEVKYALSIKVHHPFERQMFIRAEFQNPLNKKAPFIEEAILPEGQRAMTLAHGPVKGLKAGRSYWVKITIYEVNDRNNVIDTLTQEIRSYVESTGGKIMIKKDLEKKK